MIDQKYEDWMAANVSGNGFGDCKKITEAMAAEFPELKRVRGHYYCMIWGERGHWWLTDSEGQIVDPTCQQFPSRGGGRYVPWDEGTEEPTGRCPNCGGLIFGGGQVCSDACGDELASSCLNDGRY